MSQPVIIAGFHRSGTSAVARALSLGGLFLGDDLLGARPSNPHGHFEDLEVIHIHRDLLEVNGTSWLSHEPFDPFVPDGSWSAIEELVRKRNASGEPWGFKDPRVCLFMPLWLHVLPRANVVVVYRSPGEAVRSLHARHSRQLVTREGPPELHNSFWTIPDLGVRMWVNYHRMLLRTLPESVHFVDFADRGAVAAIASTLEHKWHLGLDRADRAALDPSLGLTPVDDLPVSDHRLIGEVREIWGELEARR